MTENEFLLQDRIAKIRSMNELYDLEHNSYIAFSGGKDSSVLSALIDMALPNNKIPRLYINTGIEYKFMVEHIHELMKTDNRIIEKLPKIAIKPMLEKYGYPMKSKEHSQKLKTYQNVGMCKTVKDYLGIDTNKDRRYWCTKKLRYQFSPDFKLKISSKCCDYLKKIPAQEFAEEYRLSISITGMRSEEGGARLSRKECAVFKGDTLSKFHPLKPINSEWVDWFIETYNVPLCKLYYPPFNFNRTGCVCCPYGIELQDELDLLEKYLPTEKKRAEIIWKPVYEEYRKVGYRLRKE